MRRVLLVVLVLSLLAGRADASPFPAASVAAGPVWAGERVVWVERHGREHAVLVGDPATGARRVVDRWRSRIARSSVTLAASAETLAVVRVEGSCPPFYCRESLYSTLVDQLRVGPVDGPLTLAPPCEFGSSVVVTGRAYALHCPGDGAEYGRIVIREEGTERTAQLGDGMFAMAGRMLAAPVGSPAPGQRTGVRVIDRLSGEEVRRVAGSPWLFLAVDADGSVAYTEQVGVRPDGTSIEHVVSAPAGEDPRPVSLPPGALRLAGGRVASVGDYELDRKRRFAVADARSGATLASTERWSASAFDFDGRRLVWGEAPCGRTTIQVWQLGSPQPPALPRDCGRPRVHPFERWPPGRGRLRLSLSCPKRPAGGCGGTAAVFVSGVPPGQARRADPVGRGEFDIAAGARGYADLDVGNFYRAPGHGFTRRHLRVEITAYGSRDTHVQRVPLTRRANAR